MNFNNIKFIPTSIYAMDISHREIVLEGDSKNIFLETPVERRIIFLYENCLRFVVLFYNYQEFKEVQIYATGVSQGSDVFTALNGLFDIESNEVNMLFNTYLFNAINSNYKFFLHGHSLGGIFIYEIKKKLISQYNVPDSYIHMLAIGSPDVGNTKDNINNNDIICLLSKETIIDTLGTVFCKSYKIPYKSYSKKSNQIKLGKLAFNTFPIESLAVSAIFSKSLLNNHKSKTYSTNPELLNKIEELREIFKSI